MLTLGGSWISEVSELQAKWLWPNYIGSDQSASYDEELLAAMGECCLATIPNNCGS